MPRRDDVSRLGAGLAIAALVGGCSIAFGVIWLALGLVVR
jgi:hypothetical protein